MKLDCSFIVEHLEWIWTIQNIRLRLWSGQQVRRTLQAPKCHVTPKNRNASHLHEVQHDISIETAPKTHKTLRHRVRSNGWRLKAIRKAGMVRNLAKFCDFDKIAIKGFGEVDDPWLLYWIGSPKRRLKSVCHRWPWWIAGTCWKECHERDWTARISIDMVEDALKE